MLVQVLKFQHGSIQTYQSKILILLCHREIKLLFAIENIFIIFSVDKEWKSLTNSLAGLLCASLNFVEPLNTLSPEFSMPPTSALNHKPNSSYLRYSTLPRETACTENLTPFKKLLPCDSKVGDRNRD